MLSDGWMELSEKEESLLRMNPVVLQRCECKEHGRAFCKLLTGKHQGRLTGELLETSQKVADMVYDRGGHLTTEIKALELYEILEWMENYLEFHEDPPCCKEDHS